ncbi:MAG: GNAT family N-acetyltransferase [Pseudobutyrivibrio sp.]|nr:GNAT family N-acetyltransferase [Pseudobutyrivibrio sp.]
MEGKNKTYLRRAKEEDVDLIFKWANDTQVRANAFNSEPISYTNHLKWYDSSMKSESRIIYILFKEDIPLGQIRVDLDDGLGLIDYSIDANHRGVGYGTLIIGLLMNKIKEEHKDIKELKAQVKYENLGSQKCFEKNNYSKETLEEYVEYTLFL